MSRFSLNLIFNLQILIKAMEGRTDLFRRNQSVRISIKKVPEGTSLNGASNGLNFEPYCVKLAHHLLHDEYTINTIKMLLKHNYTNKRYNRNKS